MRWIKVSLLYSSYLAWNHSAVEDGVLRRRAGVGGTRVHVNGVQPLVPREELLPQRPQRQLPPYQEQERNLRHAAVRCASDPRRHGRPPEQLRVCHVVHDAARSKEAHQPHDRSLR